MSIKKWLKIKTSEAYNTPWLKVRNDSFVLPNNKNIDYTIIERGTAVAILAITNQDEVVLVEQYRPAVDSITLDLSGGGVEEGETPEEAALRELEEETGYRASHIEQLTTFFQDSGRSEGKIYIFLAKDLFQVGQKLDENEIIEVKKIPIKKLKEDILLNQIQEPLLILSIFLYEAKNN